jgi:hypothetical protein
MLKDDPAKEHKGKPFPRGGLSFAGWQENSRATNVFIAFKVGVDVDVDGWSHCRRRWPLCCDGVVSDMGWPPARPPSPNRTRTDAFLRPRLQDVERSGPQPMGGAVRHGRRRGHEAD